MREIALLELANDQMPISLSSLQQVLEKNGLIGDYREKGESLVYKGDGVTIEFTPDYDPSQVLNRGGGIDIAGKGNMSALVETLIALMEIFESEFKGSILSSEYLEE
jgi:hypothetical protein